MQRIFMKRFYSFFLSAGCAFILFSFTNELLKQLQLSDAEAKEAIKENFIKQDLWFPDKQAIKGLVVTKRAATVKDLGNYIRQYVESPEFNKAYQEARAAAKPAGKADVKTLIAERLLTIEGELKEMDEKIKTSGADMKKLYEVSINSLKEERKALQNPKHPMHNDYVENLTAETNEEQQEMEMEYFEKAFPPTVKELVKMRLKHFLQLTATIDFNAKLVQQGKHKVFADAALEAKDANWKRCFRAGPETINAARQFAQQWLVDLSK
jgi:hypothetical protein